MSSQPALTGYQYRVTEEHYVVQAQDGRTGVGDRRRESWRAPDGWTWARQTGTDPGQFIFPPSVDWKPVQSGRPDPADQERILSRTVGQASSSDKVEMEFSYVQDLLGSETLPATSMPEDYRTAVIDALDLHDSIAVTRHAVDPRERDSIRVTLAGSAFTQSIYLDRNHEYLANKATDAHTGEKTSRVVISRRHVASIPQDLLVELGSARVEKTEWS